MSSDYQPACQPSQGVDVWHLAIARDGGMLLTWI